jgi:hypothetical protein
MTMKYLSSIAAAGTMLWLVGCSSVHQSADPGMNARPDAMTKGSLQVASAGQSTVVDLNAEEFRANNDFGRSASQPHPVATDYKIRTPDAEVATHR